MTGKVTKPIRILLLDDDEDDYLIIRNFITKIDRSPFKLEWVSSPEEAATLIGREEHDIYLVDYRLGSQNGLELLSQFDLVQRPEPFIILTGAGDERIERKAMRMGVADYLVKSKLDSELLSRVLHYALQRKSSEAQRVQHLMEINRSKDEFIALASHQLRTPATAVKQYIGMILEGFAGEVSPEQERFLRSAYDSNERQIQVVNDILRVAKLDLKKIILKKEQTDMNTLMESILSDLESQFAGRDQATKLNKSEGPAYAFIDSEYVRMAISNIVDNASKYTPEGKGITASIHSELQDMVAISISDEGVGIAQRDLGKLFKKFSRIENSLSVKVGGTGLGLYWSKEIIEIHGGSIDVESEVGKGTTFTILLPAAATPMARPKTGRLKSTRKA